MENNYAFGTVLFVTTTFFLSCISTWAHVAEETEKYFKNKRILLNSEEDMASAILNLRSKIETLENRLEHVESNNGKYEIIHSY